MAACVTLHCTAAKLRPIPALATRTSEYRQGHATLMSLCRLLLKAENAHRRNSHHCGTSPVLEMKKVIVHADV